METVAKSMREDWLKHNKITICEEVKYVPSPLLDELDKNKDYEGEWTSTHIAIRRYYKKLEGCKCECCGVEMERGDIIYRSPSSFSSQTKSIYCISCSFMSSWNRNLIKKIGLDNYYKYKDVSSDIEFISWNVKMNTEYSSWGSSRQGRFNEIKGILDCLSEYGLNNIKFNTQDLKYKIVDNPVSFFKLALTILRECKKRLKNKTNPNTVEKITIEFKRELDDIVKPFRSEEDFDF